MEDGGREFGEPSPVQRVVFVVTGAGRAGSAGGAGGGRHTHCVETLAACNIMHVLK